MLNPALFEVTRAWEEAEVHYWLFGGHGVELLVGQDTRPHDDIDFFVLAEDTEKALPGLEGLGFNACHGSLEAGDIFYQRAHTVLDIVPIQNEIKPKTLGELANKYRLAHGVLDALPRPTSKRRRSNPHR